MTPEAITTFLGGYLHSLKEETMDGAKGSRYGIDHIILKLAEADGQIPLRLAFYRGGRAGTQNPKKEHEYGEDLKVISRDGKKLTIFVLKDEPLTYRNWTDEKFDKDIRHAATPNLKHPRLVDVKEVKIVLAYNKDDNLSGIEAYEKLIGTFGTRIGPSKAKLTFERWNLTDLTERVRTKLVESPSLLPGQFFHSFSYICLQVEDSPPGSDQWRDILLPHWREFLNTLLKGSVIERDVRMVSVALMILHSHGPKSPSWETGWIELMEMAMLALWNAALQTKRKAVKDLVYTMWTAIYLEELRLYYVRNRNLLTTADSLSIGGLRELSEAISTHHAYWHLGRLGILGSAVMHMEAMRSKDRKRRQIALAIFTDVLDVMVGMMNANQACYRPLLDIHHIEIYLMWLLLTAAEREDEATVLLSEIHERLILRRLGHAGLRLIDQRNSWPALLETMASGDKPPESFGKSSYLLQMVIEICACKLGKKGQDLAWAFYQHLILGCSDEGESWNFPERVELQSWVPPENWQAKILDGPIYNEGICVTIHYGGPKAPDRASFSSKVREFVAIAQKAHPPERRTQIPFSVAILACITHRSPLPPDFWRAAFGKWSAG